MSYAAHEPTPEALHARDLHHASQRWNPLGCHSDADLMREVARRRLARGTFDIDAIEDLKVAAGTSRARPKEVLVIELDDALVGVEVKREPLVSVDGAVHAHHDGRVLPRVYGPIPASAVLRVISLKSFVG